MGPTRAVHPARWTDFSLRSFSVGRDLATTYYFYWHDLTDPERSARSAGRFHVPPDPAHYSFLLPETHQREFSDMLAAGLDFVLPVYWGEPGHPGRTTSQTAPHYWSTEGIPPMVEALERNEQPGAPPLQIGMFYDTTILANADLTTAGGQGVLLRQRARLLLAHPTAVLGGDRRPTGRLALRHDLDQPLRPVEPRLPLGALREDFGGLRLFVVRESQWQTSKGVVPASRLSPATGCTRGARRRSASTRRPS